MSRNSKSYSLHHELPSSRWGATNDINCEMIKENTHRAIHTLFANQMFAEKIITMTNLDAKALRSDVVEEILEVLERRDINNPYDWYKEWAILFPKNKKKIYY